MTDPAARLTEALSDRYRILKEAGAGGMATVFLAEDVKHRRKVAVKVLRPELAASLGAQRFLREIGIAAGLQHPNIVGLLDSGAFASVAGGPEDRPYYVMPFVEGESLRQRLARSGELPVGEAVRLLCEITDALAHAHRRGVVHRDMKPDNVMLSERHALVTDFGVAKAVTEAHGSDHQATSVGMALGTPAYMSPEQAAADPHVDHRADIYAIGAMAYELLAGRPPFTGGSPQQVLMAQVTQAPEPLGTHRPNLPPGLEQAIMRCLAKRPADRFQTADELLAALEPHSTTSASSTPASTAPVRAVSAGMPDRWYGHPVRVAAIFAVAATVVLGLVWVLTKQVGLPTWVMTGAVGLLAIGLPIMLVTGWVERRRAVAHATGMFHASGETGLHQLTWGRSVRGGVLAFGALALVALGYMVMRLAGIGPVGTLLASGKLAARDKIVVADFENRTADSTLGASVTEAFRIDLAQSPVVNVLASSSVGQALQRMGRESAGRLDASTAREVALRENAKAIVVGEISPVGKGIVLSARLVSASDGSEMVALRETAADESQVLEAIDKLSKGMRERFGESLKRLRNTEPLEQVTTASLEALRLYTQGARAADEGRYDDGIGLMQQSIAADSTFGMAWRKLAVLLGNTRTSESRRVEAAAQAYRLRDRLPEVERYLADAYYFWTVDFQPEKVVSAYRAVLQINPDEPTSLNNLAIELAREGKHAEAEQLIRHALTTGDVSAFYSVLINVLLEQGQGDSALAVADTMVRRLPGSEGVLFKAGALNSMGRYDSSEVLLRQSLNKGLPPSSAQFAHFQLRAIAGVQGRLEDAGREKERQQAIFERRGQPEGILASETGAAMSDLTMLRDHASALRKLDAGLQRVPMASLPVADRPYPWVASVYAMAGRPDRARQLMEEYEREVPETLRRGDAYRHVAEGTIALAGGQPKEALEAFRTYTREIGCEACGKAFEAQAWEAMGEPDSAIAAYRAVAKPGGDIARVRSDGLLLTPALKRMGNLQEERGDKAGAIESYTRVLQNWQRADPAMQPQVKEVKQRLAKLTGEPE